MFVDIVKIKVKSGRGGDGAVSFHREKYIANGGPDGGDGGRGGDVVFVADKDMRTLLDFRYKRKYAAGDGQNGTGNFKTGKRGEDVVITVPAGTVIKEAESGRILCDMYSDSERKVILRGGNAGKGNARFATATRQAPNFAQGGGAGREMELQLELKTIADVGLIGFPNVGKSTILSVITKARPKIANYHFTTLAPNLGVCGVDSYSFIIADIPGLIEGAHQGAGLGHDFLRHIERTRMLLHVVDISGCEGRDPVEDYDIINRELSQYSPALSALPQLIVANKCELPGAQENIKRLREHTGREVFEVSAAANKGFLPLLRQTAAILKTLPLPEPIMPDEIYTPREDSQAFEIYRDGEVYVVAGPYVDRLLLRVNLDDPDSFKYFQRQLREKGIIDALKAAGAGEGSVISMGDLEFDYVE